MRVIFDKQYNEWSGGLQRIDSWQQQYKRDNPNVTKSDMDRAFTSGIENIENWKKDYLLNNSGATEAEVKQAFDAIWEKK